MWLRWKSGEFRILSDSPCGLYSTCYSCLLFCDGFYVTHYLKTESWLCKRLFSLFWLDNFLDQDLTNTLLLWELGVTMRAVSWVLNIASFWLMLLRHWFCTYFMLSIIPLLDLSRWSNHIHIVFYLSIYLFVIISEKKKLYHICRYFITI